MRNDRRIYLLSAWLLASIATLISLYFSEIKHIAACPLCWYQRAALFPLPILLLQQRPLFLKWAKPLPFIGVLFAAYQLVSCNHCTFFLIHPLYTLLLFSLLTILLLKVDKPL